MHFSIFFFLLVLILTSQVLATNPRYKQRSNGWFVPEDTNSEIFQRDWKTRDLDFKGAKADEEYSSEFKIDEEKGSWNEIKSLYPNRDSTWWPSKVDYSDALNKFPASSISVSSERAGIKKPATFEELEERNANIHNPLLNLDHYPIPSKKYTFEELENMNANLYNPYLD